jgi:molybdopterin-containing oxidoreductase family membrane subunit
MKERAGNFVDFVFFCAKEILRGPIAYYAWLAFLGLIILIGAEGYLEQLIHGHIVSNMRDPVPWGLFIGTYAFLVGVAAAAMALAVPGYVYNWKPIKEIVVLGEIIAVTAVVMAILYVVADLGHPERFWHMVPIVGKANLPVSMIGLNVMILNAYLVLNIVIVTYFLYCSYRGRPYNKIVFMALMLTSIPAAISIHTTTAFIFNVLPARPYWNSAILVPRFIATALTAGPALMIITFQILRKVAKIDIQDKALLKIAEMMLIVLIVSLLLFFAELVTELRSATAHTVHIQFYFSGHSGEGGLGAWAWTGAACNVIAFILLLIPKTRRWLVTLNIACVLVFVGVFIEKGIGLVLPGFFPGTLGETYEYVPSLQELKVGAGIAAIGCLVFSVLSKAAIPLAFKGASENGEQAVVEENEAGDSADFTYSRARGPQDSVLTGRS